MDIKKINEFLLEETEILNGDYLYLHDNDGDILFNKMDFSKLYFVVKNSESGLEIHGLLSNETKNVQLKELSGFWWVFKLSLNERRALQIDKKN